MLWYKFLKRINKKIRIIIKYKRIRANILIIGFRLIIKLTKLFLIYLINLYF